MEDGEGVGEDGGDRGGEVDAAPAVVGGPRGQGRRPGYGRRA